MLSYRWVDVVPGFDMPIRVTLADTGEALIRPTETWQTARLALNNPDEFRVDENYYVETKRQ